MAKESLFLPAKIPENSIERMRGEIDPHLAAQEYEDCLHLAARQRDEHIYRHDLILLGLGADGHTASLFPGTPALEEKARTVVSNFVPKLNAWRLSFTFPLINQARHICFLVELTKRRAIDRAGAARRSGASGCARAAGRWADHLDHRHSGIDAKTSTPSSSPGPRV